MPKTNKHQWKCEKSSHCLSHKHECNICNETKQAGELTLWSMGEGHCKKKIQAKKLPS